MLHVTQSLLRVVQNILQSASPYLVTRLLINMRKVNSPGTRQIVSTILFNVPPNAGKSSEDSDCGPNLDEDGDLDLEQKEKGKRADTGV